MKVEYVEQKEEFRPIKIILEYGQDVQDLQRILGNAKALNVEYNFAHDLYHKINKLK